MNQISFFFQDSPPLITGKDLRDKGIKRAINHANKQKSGWQEIALSFLEKYCKTHHRFSGEMVRIESKFEIPEPPSLRSWGAVLMAGSRKGWITQIGYVHVDNPRAHMANAAVWESRIMEK